MQLGGLVQLELERASTRGLELTAPGGHSMFEYPAVQQHSHFSSENIEQTFNGRPELGRKLTCTISRNGDLCGRTYLVVDLPEVRGRGVRWVPDVGHALVRSVAVVIGGREIDRHTGEWMRIWSALSKDPAHVSALVSSKSPRGSALPAERLYVPLDLFFCLDPAAAIPLISIRFREVRINVDTRAVAELLEGDVTYVGPGTEKQLALQVEYTFLDTDERRFCAQTARETAIVTVEHKTYACGQTELPLRFTHQSKEIVFVCHGPDGAVAAPVRSAHLSIRGSGNRRDAGSQRCDAGSQRCDAGSFQRRDAAYFNVVQPLQKHRNSPAPPGVYVYSFALFPEDYQPSGHVTMNDRTDAVLHLDLEPGEWTATVYSRGYRALRVMSGMAGFVDYGESTPSESLPIA